MTRLNAHFSVKGISLLNSVISLSSSVQCKYYLCNQVCDIAENEDSPTKQARGDNGKEPKLFSSSTSVVHLEQSFQVSSRSSLIPSPQRVQVNEIIK